MWKILTSILSSVLIPTEKKKKVRFSIKALFHRQESFLKSNDKRQKKSALKYTAVVLFLLFLKGEAANLPSKYLSL